MKRYTKLSIESDTSLDNFYDKVAKRIEEFQDDTHGVEIQYSSTTQYVSALILQYEEV